jgi:hypothetical protein
MIVLLATLLAAPAVDVDTTGEVVPGGLSAATYRKKSVHRITARNSAAQKTRIPRCKAK